MLSGMKLQITATSDDSTRLVHHCQAKYATVYTRELRGDGKMYIVSKSITNVYLHLLSIDLYIL